MKITLEQLKEIVKTLNDENIYNFRNFKDELDKVLGEEYLSIYIPLFGYIFSELKLYSDAELIKANDEQLMHIVTFINEFKDSRNMNFVYASRM